MEFVYIVRFGEIWIKGKNRRFFEQALEQNIRRTLSRAGRDTKIEKERGRLYVLESADDPGETAALLSRVPGIVSVSVGIRCEKSVESLAENGLKLMRKMALAPVSFKVESKRADKTFPIPSPQLSRAVAEHLLTHGLDVPVDVHRPEMVFGVEIQQHGAYAFCRTLRGAGGLPAGVSGKVALLLSGGIDSPVAGYRMQKRGATVEPVYFHGFPFTSDMVKDKVARLAKKLAFYQDSLTLHVVNFTPVLTALKQSCPEKFTIIVMRRFMVRIAAEIAEKSGCRALVTGDNLGQVASQTLDNLECVTEASPLMILRPLLSFDKFEIIEQAKQIGTYDISIEPHEDCCALFVPKFPEIYGKPEEARKAENGMDIYGLVAECVVSTEEISV
ncbi:MAG: tRNA 4-thiouridine(8) synthase ThiI [Acidobacteria bacterium]|nr:tRNA 4-thiouridine(8) synthase ThiI [Acidobacteriota bacterium]